MHTDNGSIQLYVITHKEMKLPRSEILIPIRSDRNDGDNISDKEDYCELRAQYWIWKNISNVEYIGFFHYRRYLKLGLYNNNKLRTVKPYTIKWKPNIKGYQKKLIGELIYKYDLIAPVAEEIGESVWEHYDKSAGHSKEDLIAVYQIVKKNYPQYLSAADYYLSGTKEYFGNIYIMRGEIFRDYCKWVFDILSEFDNINENKLKFSDGHLGERLFGIWFTHQKEYFKWLEVPRIHFFCYDDNEHIFLWDAIVNFFLPPGSKRRFAVKKITKRGVIFEKKQSDT